VANEKSRLESAAQGSSSLHEKINKELNDIVSEIVSQSLLDRQITFVLKSLQKMLTYHEQGIDLNFDMGQWPAPIRKVIFNFLQSADTGKYFIVKLNFLDEKLVHFSLSSGDFLDQIGFCLYRRSSMLLLRVMQFVALSFFKKIS